MNSLLTLCRHDSLSAARSTFSWTLVAGFAAFTNLLLLISLYVAEGSIQTLQTLYATALIVSLPALCALATMRSFTEERQNGTLETLLTLPVTDRQVVFAKFGAALLLVVVAMAASLGGFVLYVETALPAPVYSRTGIASSLAVILLHAAGWTAVGILTSLLTRHQAVAAVACLLATGPHSLIASGLAPGILPSSYLDSLSIAHVARGVLDSRPILLSATLTALFLFLAVRVLEARRWSL